MALGKAGDFLTALGMEAIPVAGEFGRSYLRHSSRDRDRKLQEGYARRLAQNALGFGILGAQGTYGSALNALGQGGQKATGLYGNLVSDQERQNLRRREIEGIERVRDARTRIQREKLRQNRMETLRDAIKEKREREARQRFYESLRGGEGPDPGLAYEAGLESAGNKLLESQLGGGKADLSQGVRDRLRARGLDPAEARPEDIKRAMDEEFREKAQIAGMRGAQKIQIERGVYGQEPVPGTIEELTGQRDWGSLRRPTDGGPAYNVPEPKKRQEWVVEIGADLGATERFAAETRQVENTLRTTPEAYGVTGDISAAFRGLRDQLQNVTKITGFDPNAEVSEADFMTEDVQTKLDRAADVGGKNRQLRAKIIELAFDAARAEQGGGNRIPVKLLETKLNALTGNTQSPTVMADTIADRRLEQLAESRSSLKAKLGRDPRLSTLYSDPRDAAAAYNRGDLSDEDLRELARDRVLSREETKALIAEKMSGGR